MAVVRRGPSTTPLQASPERANPRRWWWLAIAAAAVFAACAGTIFIADVPGFERRIYDAVTAALPATEFFRRMTRFGTVNVLLPLSVFLAVLLPRQFLRRWWMWIVVMIAVTAIEGLGKVGVGRPRPEGMRPGFPSGHTAAAAAFYLMACYFFDGVVRRWAKYALYAVAAVVIALVGLSRLVLRVHWPLDVLGGAALGTAVFAFAAWWHERYPLEDVVSSAVPAPWRAWLYRWQNVLALGLIAVVVVAPRSAAAADVAVDTLGGLCIVTGLALRLWADAHREPRARLAARLPARLVTTGPYALMRHPLPLANLMTGVGLALVAQSAVALLVVPAALIAMYRLTAPVEDGWLAERFGAAYVDYCARVPALPRVALATVAAVWSAVGSLRAASWPSVVRSLPAVGVTLALAALAELGDAWPRLFR
jgi:undecaprenyl-diphosphatase